MVVKHTDTCYGMVYAIHKNKNLNLEAIMTTWLYFDNLTIIAPPKDFDNYRFGKLFIYFLFMNAHGEGEKAANFAQVRNYS